MVGKISVISLYFQIHIIYIYNFLFVFMYIFIDKGKLGVKRV